MRFIYADTSIWNCLCDQNPDPGSLTSTLADRDVGFAIGWNVFFEIAKQFFSGAEKAAERGRELFAYMNRYLALRVPIVKENSALLIEEALDVTRTQRMESCFRNESDYQITVQEIAKLCKGDIGSETARFFENRKSVARNDRTNMRENLDAQPDLKTALNGISEDALPDFIRTASVGPQGCLVLLGRLRREFPGNSPNDLAGVAKILLETPQYRVSRAMTRADLCLNWRCVHRGSIRSDLPDDTFHVVSAAYCDVFVTREADQSDIARHSIEGIQTVVCGENESISDRLLSGVY